MEEIFADAGTRSFQLPHYLRNIRVFPGQQSQRGKAQPAYQQTGELCSLSSYTRNQLVSAETGRGVRWWFCF